MPRPDSLSAAQARRLVIGAQGLSGPRPAGRVDRRHFRNVIRRLGAIQIDSVNVLARAHRVPFFSRLGPHDSGLLDRLAYRDHELFEYWGHAASLVDVELEPVLRWRMADTHPWSRPSSVANRRPDLVSAIEEAVVSDGPLSAAELEQRMAEERPRKGPWWDWSDTKSALEYLFWAGRVGALRRGNFERVYCGPDIAVPASIRSLPTPAEDEAKRRLLEVAVRAHGVATAADLADYWRLRVDETKRLLRDMAGDGALTAVRVEGWKEPGFVAPDVRIPREGRGRALVSPFDAAMWERRRVERIHGFDYKIEIYVPAPERRYGYYCLPFLLGDTFVARVDLKADRDNRRLLVQAAHAEPDLDHRGTDPGAVAAALAAELRDLSAWLELDDIEVNDRGELGSALAALST